jgi:transcriptional regulator with XRE-family HTH domain
MTGHRKFSEIRKDRGDREREARVAQYRREFQDAISLADLRRARELTQAQLGMALDMPQSAVSRLERQTDLYVSTLRSYVEAMGGELVIEALFDDKRLVIGTFSSLAEQGETHEVLTPGRAEDLAAAEPSGD